MKLLEKKFMEDQQIAVEFLPYKSEYKEDIKRLSLEWLEKYVWVEPEDVEFMENPTSYVIDKGGFIFLAKYNQEIIGTVSLNKQNDNTYELAKLAVTEKYKGMKIGKQLTQIAIDKCKELNAKQIILYTTKKLETAYQLYLKFGFVNVVEEKLKYLGADTKMVLDLTI